LAQVDGRAGLDGDSGPQQQQDAPQRGIRALVVVLVRMIVHDGTKMKEIRPRISGRFLRQI
jgi:hypothetical protein